MITLGMLLSALSKTAVSQPWVDHPVPGEGAYSINGSFDLAKAVDLLNDELIRQAQTSEPVGMLDLNVTAWDGT